MINVFTNRTPMPYLVIIVMFVLSLLLPAGCINDDIPVIISTDKVSIVTNNSAISGGEIVYGEETGITEKGLVWSTFNDPTTDNYDGIRNIKSDNNKFTGVIEGLEPGTVYYVRAYATGSSGTSYGEEQVFKTFSGKVEDADGNIYYTLQIGENEWTGSNLRTGKYSNGDVIPVVTDEKKWSSLTSGAWTVYNNDYELQTVYGNLYNWYAVTDERGLCPAGWRVPTDGDWKVLEMTLGMSSASSNRVGIRDRYAGGKLKETGTGHWLSPNILATNEYGFTALPGGYRHPRGQFYTLRRNLNWWTSTGHDEYNAWYRNIYYNNAAIYRNIYGKTSGFSVRCVRDRI